MKLGRWFSQRGPGFIRRRAAVLWKRYGLRPGKAQHRLEACLANLIAHECAPTLLTPGRVVRRYPLFIRRLQGEGAEIAVHSYDHIDLTAIPAQAAVAQLVTAARTFERFGLDARGFRCPYLSYRDDLADALPDGLFRYSSNAAIRWDLNPMAGNGRGGVVFQTIDTFYQPRESGEVACVPWLRNKLVEIPVCVPDDLQLHDGLGFGPEAIAEAWIQILHQTHRRGELFSLIFHPELAECCEQPFKAVLREARRLRPAVWVARLRDISDWWAEKSAFQCAISQVAAGLRISLTCSSRATVLIKGSEPGGIQEPWDGTYFRVRDRVLEVPFEPRPFVGLAPDVPGGVATFLRDQGYILDRGASALRCAVYLDNATSARQGTQVELVNWIERSAGPLVRYGRWPAGAKSALCVTGDLDALSLVDYVSRLGVRS